MSGSVRSSTRMVAGSSRANRRAARSRRAPAGPSAAGSAAAGAEQALLERGVDEREELLGVGGEGAADEHDRPAGALERRRRGAQQRALAGAGRAEQQDVAPGLERREDLGLERGAREVELGVDAVREERAIAEQHSQNRV